MTAAHQLEPARGFVVVLPAFSANARLRPVVRATLHGKRYAEMVPTAKYTAWKREAGQELMIQRPKAVSGRVAVSIVLVPHKTNMDADNVIKAALDLLVDAGKIDGDTVKTIRCLSIEVWPDKSGLPIKPGEMQVRVRALSGGAE